MIESNSKSHVTVFTAVHKMNMHMYIVYHECNTDFTKMIRETRAGG